MDKFKTVHTAPGNCSTYNIIYLIKCKICDKPYIGKSTRALRTRFGEHRRAFYKVIKTPDSIDSDDDEFSIGLHLYHEHNIDNRKDFNLNVNVSILENVSPYDIDCKEHKYIHRFKSLRPLGINTINPFKIPIMHI